MHTEVPWLSCGSQEAQLCWWLKGCCEGSQSQPSVPTTSFLNHSSAAFWAQRSFELSVCSAHLLFAVPRPWSHDGSEARQNIAFSFCLSLSDLFLVSLYLSHPTDSPHFVLTVSYVSLSSHQLGFFLKCMVGQIFSGPQLPSSPLPSG